VPKRAASCEPDRTAEPDAYEAVFTALAHPVRRRILITLHFRDGSMTAGEIAGLFEHAWPTTTVHVQALESAGLVHHERQGRARVYHLDRRRLDLVRDWLAWFAKAPDTRRQRRKT
jgi:DNA-binding transcriptional ArsR family regulator